MAVSTRYGWHRDELYFLEAGSTTSPGATSTSRRSRRSSPGSPTRSRRGTWRCSGSLPAITAVVTIVLGTLIARELGASRAAGRSWPPASMAAGGFALGRRATSSPPRRSTSPPGWRCCGSPSASCGPTQPRWWLAFGAVAGVALLNKDLVVLLAVALLIGLVVERRWALLRSPWLLAGGALALLIAAPNLLWQADHGWPQREMAEALSERLAGENRSHPHPAPAPVRGPALRPGALVGGEGARHRAPGPGRYRALLWTWIAGVVIAFVTAGRPYYVLPLTTVVLLVGVRRLGAARTHRGS